MLKLYDLLNEVIFEERNLLIESVSDNEINDAMDKRYKVWITYQGAEEDTPSARLIAVYAYGTTKRGNKVIRAFQDSGATRRNGKRIAWKYFRIDRILSWEPTDFYLRKDKSISDINPSIPKYNKVGDKSMSTFFRNVKLDPSWKFGQNDNKTNKNI